MNSIEVIKKFIESNWVLERAVREILERFPLKFRYGISYGPTFRYWLAFLKESEKWDRDRLEAYQVEQLRDLLIYAGKNIPYYRKIFKEYGFKPERVQSLDDIKVLPYLDRITIKEKHHEFIATNIPKSRLISATTSGTAGIPLIVCGTKETEEKHWATVVDLWGRIGYGPRSRTVFFEANIREGNRENLPWKMHGNKLVLSSNYFIDEWLDKYVEMINNFKPEYMMGFPHTIATFSSFARNKRRTIFEGLKGIIVYSENVYKWQRQLIKETFGTRVFSDYGMVEKVIHGGECENSHAYHLYPQYGFTEYLPLQNSLQELVGTGFINYAMPLIRYRTGDICTKDGNHCLVCGRNYDLLEEIEGRIGDFLVNVDGQIISVNLTMDTSVFEHTERFQLYQESPGEVELRIWPEDSYSGEDSNKLLNDIQRSIGQLGRRMKFKIILMGNKRLHSSVKYKMVDQRLDLRDFLK